MLQVWSDLLMWLCCLLTLKRKLSVEESSAAVKNKNASECAACCVGGLNICDVPEIRKKSCLSSPSVCD